MNCQIEFANDDVGMPWGKTAVALPAALSSGSWRLPLILSNCLSTLLKGMFVVCLADPLR
jgi:hypothetical protein